VEVGPEALARFFEVVRPHLNERQRRVMAGACSQMLGRGGKSAVASASHMSRNTVIKAEREVEGGIEPSEHLRAAGGGDRPLIDKQPGLLQALDELVSMAKPRFPKATRLLITADAGGSNGYRVRAWKNELAALAEGTGLEITVCQYPPGTSKWNKIVLYTGFPGVYEVTNEAVRSSPTGPSSS
jgi:hypothetical protein